MEVLFSLQGRALTQAVRPGQFVTKRIKSVLPRNLLVISSQQDRPFIFVIRLSASWKEPLGTLKLKMLASVLSNLKVRVGKISRYALASGSLVQPWASPDNSRIGQRSTIRV